MNENNGVRQSLEAFRDKIQARVKERMSRPSMTQALHEQSKQQAEKKSPWFMEFKADKATYVIMGISGIFTALLGLILGLAPTLVTQADGSTYIEFHTDFIHWTIAIIYAVAFVTVTEAAFLIAKNKYHTREEGNPVQHNTMLAMMIAAGISIVGTGYAGGVIGASVLGFLSDFREIPHAAQGWVVKVIPILLAFYAFLLAAYKLSSEEEKSNRLTEQMKIQQRREHKLQRELAELEVEEMMALAEDKAYIEAVERGALSAGEAAAARRAGKTLRQLEKEKGEDLNGDGIVEGNTQQADHATMHTLADKTRQVREKAEAINQELKKIVESNQPAPFPKGVGPAGNNCKYCGQPSGEFDFCCAEHGELYYQNLPAVKGTNGQNPH